MLTVLIIITLLYQVVFTAGSIMVWRTVKNNNPEQLPKVFFATTAIRLFTSVVVFALAMWLIHSDMEHVKIFTVFFLAVYMLLLVFDTAYFYCSSQKIKK